MNVTDLVPLSPRLEPLANQVFIVTVSLYTQANREHIVPFFYSLYAAPSP